VIVALVLFVKWWKHKGWTIKEKLLGLKDKAERRLEKQREARLKTKQALNEEKYPEEKKRGKGKKQLEEKKCFHENSQPEEQDWLKEENALEEQQDNVIEEEKK